MSLYSDIDHSTHGVIVQGTSAFDPADVSHLAQSMLLEL